MQVGLHDTSFCILLGARPASGLVSGTKKCVPVDPFPWGDNDDQEHPNAFEVVHQGHCCEMNWWTERDSHLTLIHIDPYLLISFGNATIAGHGVKLKDVKAGFPLPGQYHFRFKMKWEFCPEVLGLHRLMRDSLKITLCGHFKTRLRVWGRVPCGWSWAQNLFPFDTRSKCYPSSGPMKHQKISNMFLSFLQSYMITYSCGHCFTYVSGCDKWRINGNQPSLLHRCWWESPCRLIQTPNVEVPTFEDKVIAKAWCRWLAGNSERFPNIPLLFFLDREKVYIFWIWKSLLLSYNINFFCSHSKDTLNIPKASSNLLLLSIAAEVS